MTELEFVRTYFNDAIPIDQHLSEISDRSTYKSNDSIQYEDQQLAGCHYYSPDELHDQNCLDPEIKFFLNDEYEASPYFRLYEKLKYNGKEIIVVSSSQFLSCKQQRQVLTFANNKLLSMRKIFPTREELEALAEIESNKQQEKNLKKFNDFVSVLKNLYE